jgi:HD-like signal output (HDOD) protein
MTEPDRKRIGTLLVEEGLITSGQLREALATQQKQGGKLATILIALGYLDVPKFMAFLVKQPGIAAIDISRYSISEDLVSLVDRDFAIEHEVFPLDKMGKLLTVGMVCPLDSATIKQLEEHTGLRIKPLLCSPNDLRDVITRHYGSPPEPEAAAPSAPPTTEARVEIESDLKLASLAALIRKLDSLPALPRTVQRIREVMENLEISTRDVGRILSTDPPLAAKMLRLANSAAYGFPNRVASVELAVALLGLRETYAMVLSAAVVDLMNASKTFDYTTFWYKSMLGGALASAVGKQARLEAKPGVFTAGLLQNIGRVALAEVVPHRMGKVEPDLEGLELIEAEENEFGISHTEAGYFLVSEWGFPPELAEAIRFHHKPKFADAAPEMVAAVTISDWAATADPAALTDVARFQTECSEPLKMLDLNPDAAAHLLKTMAAVLAEAGGPGEQQGTDNPSPE